MTPGRSPYSTRWSSSDAIPPSSTLMPAATSVGTQVRIDDVSVTSLSLFDALPAEQQTHHDMDVQSMFSALRRELKAGDVVAVKGGRGSGGLGDRRFLAIGKALRNGDANLSV